MVGERISAWQRGVAVEFTVKHPVRWRRLERPVMSAKAQRPEWFRKPDATLTQDPHEYVKAWKSLWDICEIMFPGFWCSGFDPSIQMTAKDFNSTFTLSVSQVEALKKGVAALVCKI